MTQQEMNLFQLTASRMTEPGARSSEVVRCEFRHLQFLGVQLDYVPNHFLGYSIAPNGSCATNAAKQFARGNSCRRKPFVEELLHPVRNGDCTNVAAFSDEIYDRPTILTPLKVVETEISKFTSSKTAAEQNGNDRSVAFALERFGVRRLPQFTSLLCGQPVPQPHSKFLDTLNTTNSGGEFWAQQPSVGGFVRQAAYPASLTLMVPGAKFRDSR